MKILFLHREDKFSQFASRCAWDLVVDLGRAPVSTYAIWSREAGCPVLCLHDFSGEMDDVRYLKGLLQTGMGALVDRTGIDWWDLLSLSIAPDLLQLLLLQRLAQKTGQGCEIYSSRPDFRSRAFRLLANGRLTILESHLHSATRLARHYSDVLHQLDATQIMQVVQDKFDGKHSIRSRLAARTRGSGSAILLPSAYINVSRTAAAYAALLPDVPFLLVLVRNSARLRIVPGNVRQFSLDAYFSASERSETAELLRSWKEAQAYLESKDEIFRAAKIAGIFRTIPSLLECGLATRDAWSRLFESHQVTGCLSADDSNPSTRIPLLLAKQRRIPALACHHGAFDYWKAAKTQHEDVYLGKGEMERDYLLRECRMAPGKIFIGAPSRAQAPFTSIPAKTSARWLVFFTEPYQNGHWRQHEVYRELMPRLMDLARACEFDLVFKIHPFESVKGFRHVLRRHLPQGFASQCKVLDGPVTNQLWENVRIAMTTESSVAVECARLGIPVFSCGWLRDSYGGYVRQFARFGVCHVLESVEQIPDIPRLLASGVEKSSSGNQLDREIDPQELRQLLSGALASPVEVAAQSAD